MKRPPNIKMPIAVTWALLATAAAMTLWAVGSLAFGGDAGDGLAPLVDRYCQAPADPNAKGADPNAKPADAKAGATIAGSKSAASGTAATTPSSGPSGSNPAAAPVAKAPKPPRKDERSPRDAQVERIAKRDLFAPPTKPQMQPPVGVMGDQALFPGNQWVKIGEPYMNGKLKDIGPDWVEIEVEGKTTKLMVFSGKGGGGEMGPGGPMPPRGARTARAAVTAEAPPASPSGPPAGMKLTPEMIEQFKQLPPEVKAQALKQMPAEIRAQLEQQGS